MGKPPLKRSTKPLLRSGGLQRSPKKMMLRNREPLEFVKAEPNPLSGKPTKNQEQKFTRELDEYGKAFRDAAKKEQAATDHAMEGYGADYFLMVFRDSRQATGFLHAIGYPDAKDVFVDGTIVADLLDVKLPEPVAPLPKKLKTVKQTTLVNLVTRK